MIEEIEKSISHFPPFTWTLFEPPLFIFKKFDLYILFSIKIYKVSGRWK